MYKVYYDVLHPRFGWTHRSRIMNKTWYVSKEDCIFDFNTLMNKDNYNKYTYKITKVERVK
jgi:hypothetical protein